MRLSNSTPRVREESAHQAVDCVSVKGYYHKPTLFDQIREPPVAALYVT